MKLQVNDVIRINQEVFNFLYSFQYGSTAFGADYYILTKISKKYYFFKEMNESCGLRHTKKQIQVLPEVFDEMTVKYPELVTVISGDARLDVLRKVMLGQLRLDEDEIKDGTSYLKDLLSV
jgi:hypothetical protein